MIDALAILGAKYLYIAVVLAAGVYFFTLPRDKQKELALYALISLPLMFIVLKVAGRLYYNARPFVVGHFTPLLPHAPDNGFPSDHTMLSAAFATVVFTYNKKLGAVLWLLTLLVGLSRVYVGIHHYLDIAASMIIAIVIAVLVYKFLLPPIKARLIST